MLQSTTPETKTSSPLLPVVLLLIAIAIVYGVVSHQEAPHAARVAQPHTTSKQSASIAQNAYTVISSPSINEEQINNVLCSAKSPACGTGAALYDLGVQYRIDPAFALAFFDHESNYGTQGVARYSLSLGNLRCIDAARCVNNYAYFDTWALGYKAWYELIAGPLYVGDGLTTVAAIIPRYAPPSDDNNDSAYIASVEQMIDLYRSAK